MENVPLIIVDIFPDTASEMVTGFHIIVLTASLQTIAKNIIVKLVKTIRKTGGLLALMNSSWKRREVQFFQRHHSEELY